MLQSDTHDDTEEAVEEAFDILDSLFNTSYSSTKTTAYHVGREMSEYYIDFEREGNRYRLSLDLWSGAVRLFDMDANGNPAVIKHT